MRKRLAIILCLLSFFTLAGITWYERSVAEPVYKGKRLSLWLEGYDLWKFRWDGPERYKADEAVRAVGTNGIPTLLRMLRAHDFPPKQSAIMFLGRQHLAKFKYRFAGYQNTEAARAFETLGASASNAAPELLEIYKHNYSPISRDCVLLALGNIGPPAKDAVPLLIGIAQQGNFNPRINAVVYLGKIHAQPDLTIPVLTKCLSDSNMELGLFAAIGLGKFGDSASNAVPDMVQLAKNIDSGRRTLVFNAIERIDSHAAGKAQAAMKAGLDQ